MSAPVDSTISECFAPGTRVTLRLTRGPTKFQVLRSFLPFHRSQVHLVRPASPDSTLPKNVIMKVYDPRYLDERFPLPHQTRWTLKLPWSLETETIAAQHRQAAAQKGKPEKHRRPLRTEEPHLWESYFYRSMKICYESEVGAYERLKSLQGTVIPKLYDTGTLIPTDARAFEPRVVILEYIPSISLADIVPGTDTADIPPTLYMSFINAVKTVGGLGVFHGDVRPPNILLSPPPPEAPERMMLIDFGEAFVKEEGEVEREVEEEWVQNTRFDRLCIINYLKKQAGIVLDYSLA